MNDDMINASQVGSAGTPPVAVWQLRTAIQQCLLNKGIGRSCNVTVNQKGALMALSGNVDTEWTHCEILSMLPDEECCVLDNIQVSPL